MTSSNSTTGKLNVQFGLKTFPLDNKGKPIDPVKGGWVWLDGFSPFMPIMTYFANLSLTASSLPSYWVSELSACPAPTQHLISPIGSSSCGRSLKE
jgi:hypothetical protein